MEKTPPAAPWSMQWRIVYACNRACWFCGIHSIPKTQRSVKIHAPLRSEWLMTLDMATELSRQMNGWMPHPRLEFGVGGESPIHPQFFDIVQTFRTHTPRGQLMVQTNIESWIEDGVAWMREFYARGGNILTLNCYLPGIADRVREVLAHPDIQALNLKISGDYYGKDRQQLKISPYYYVGPRTRQVYISDDLGKKVRDGTSNRIRSRAMTNHAGAVPDAVFRGLGHEPLQAPLDKGCMWPSKQLVIAEDGKALVCCYDQWLDKLSPGKFPEQSLPEIWDSRILWLVRQMLFNKNRSMLPCATCDYHGGFARAQHPLQKDPQLGMNESQLIEELDSITADQILTWKPHQLQAMQTWRDRLPAHLQKLIPLAELIELKQTP